MSDLLSEVQQELRKWLKGRVIGNYVSFPLDLERLLRAVYNEGHDCGMDGWTKDSTVGILALLELEEAISVRDKT